MLYVIYAIVELMIMKICAAIVVIVVNLRKNILIKKDNAFVIVIKKRIFATG